jgi:hypothetical protein
MTSRLVREKVRGERAPSRPIAFCSPALRVEVGVSRRNVRGGDEGCDAW